MSQAGAVINLDFTRSKGDGLVSLDSPYQLQIENGIFYVRNQNISKCSSNSHQHKKTRRVTDDENKA